MKILLAVCVFSLLSSVQVFAWDGGVVEQGNNWGEGKPLVSIYCPKRFPFSAISIKINKGAKSEVKLWDGKIIQFDLTGCEIY